MPYVTTVERAGIEKGEEKGRQEGLREGLREGEIAILLRLMARKFGEAAVEQHRATIEQADAETLLEWSDRILTAETPEAIFH